MHIYSTFDDPITASSDVVIKVREVNSSNDIENVIFKRVRKNDQKYGNPIIHHSSATTISQRNECDESTDRKSICRSFFVVAYLFFFLLKKKLWELQKCNVRFIHWKRKRIRILLLITFHKYYSSTNECILPPHIVHKNETWISTTTMQL